MAQFSGSEPIVDGMQLVRCLSYPGHIGYEFFVKGRKILFWGDTVHAQHVQLQHPRGHPRFSTSIRMRLRRRGLQLLLSSRARMSWIAGPHMPFPALGRLHKEGSGYSWVPVVFTINGTRNSKATVTTVMTQGPQAPFSYSGTRAAGEFHLSNNGERL